MDPGPNLDVVMPLSWPLGGGDGPLPSLRWSDAHGVRLPPRLTLAGVPMMRIAD